MASLLDSIHGGHSKKLKKHIAFRLALKEHVIVCGERLDIFEYTINRFCFGPDYQAPSDGLFIDKHIKITNEGQMSELTS